MTPANTIRLQDKWEIFFSALHVTDYIKVSSKQQMSLPADNELVQGILQQNEESVEQFVKLYEDRVYAQAFRLIGNQMETEEICQDIFMKALGSMHRFEGKSKLSTWLYRITYRTCLDLLKRRKRQPKEIDIDNGEQASWSSMENALTQLEAKEQTEMVDTSIARLGEKDAHLIDLYHLQEMSIKEIAVITGMNDNAIKVRLMRARKKLASHLIEAMPKETIERYERGR